MAHVTMTLKYITDAPFSLLLQEHVEIEVAHDVDDVHGVDHHHPHGHHAQQVGGGERGVGVETGLVQNQLEPICPGLACTVAVRGT